MTDHLLLFLAASLVLLVTPGPAVLYIVTRSVSQGALAGVVSALGVGAGALVHVAAAGLGLSAILAGSATAFSVVKYLGAAYLIWLGIQALRSGTVATGVAADAPRPLARIFREGIVVNILNPKTAIFFLAFLPQFVAPEAGSVAGQVVMLGLLFTALAVMTDSLYALLAGRLAVWLRAHPRFPVVQRRVSGSVYVGLGLATAFSGESK